MDQRGSTFFELFFFHRPRAAEVRRISVFVSSSAGGRAITPPPIVPAQHEKLATNPCPGEQNG